jgi:hypothetical protein
VLLLHLYIKAGRLSRMPDGSIDTAELVRAGFVLQAETLANATPVTPVLRDDTTNLVTPSVTAPVAAETYAYERMIDLLQQQLDNLRAHIRHAEDRERHYQERIAWLETQIGYEHQRYDRLLEAPRPLAVSPSAPRAPAAPEVSRGDMRRRIVALLQDYPEGLSPAQVRRLLAVDKDLGATMKAMARDGLLQRVAMGRYVAHQG